MIQRIQQYLTLTNPDVDFTNCTDIEVYIKQGSLFKEYTPTVDGHTLIVDIPFNDAKNLTTEDVAIQYAWTDEDGNAQCIESFYVSCGEFLKAAGYNPTPSEIQ